MVPGEAWVLPAGQELRVVDGQAAFQEGLQVQSYPGARTSGEQGKPPSDQLSSHKEGLATVCYRYTPPPETGVLPLPGEQAFSL